MFTKITEDVSGNELISVHDGDNCEIFVSMPGHDGYNAGKFFTQDEASDLLAALLSHGVRLNDRSRMLLKNSEELV